MKIRNKVEISLMVFALLFPTLTFLMGQHPVFAATYTVTNTNNSGAGSLRQAIIDANTNPGADIITFDIPPTDPNYYTPSPGISWWRIDITSELPAITESVTIDGTTQTTNRGDTNPGQVGTGGTVGVDSVPLPEYNRPEIELTTSTNINNGLTVGASTVNIKGLAIYGFKGNPARTSNAQINIASGTDVTVESCLIGTRADGSDPGFDTKTSGIYSTSTGKGIIQNNFIGYNISGIYLDGASNWNVTGNEVFQNTLRYGNSGIEMPLNANTITISGNLCRENGGAGIDSYRGTGSFNIVNNTVINNGLISIQTSGIRVYGTSNTISKNIVTSNQGPGIVIPQVIGSTYQNYQQTISQNSCYSNGGLGIDLVRDTGSEQVHARRGDGVNINDGIYDATYGNRGIDYPVITVATLIANTLHIEGYVGTSATGTTFTGVTLEFFIAAPDPSGYGEGKTYLGSITTGADNSFTGNIDVTGKGLLDTDQITGTAHDINGNTSEFGTYFNLTVADNPLLTLDITPPVYAFAGDIADFSVAIKNTSDSTAYNSVYTWQIPEEMTFISSSYPANYDPITRTVTFNLGNLNPSGQIAELATVSIDAGVPDGTLLTTNSALSWQNALGEPAGTINQTSTTLVYSKPLLTLDWSAPVRGYAGENLLIEGMLHNPGSSTALNGILVVQLPVNTNFVTSSHNAIWNPAERTITWNLGNIPAGIDINGWYDIQIDPAVADGTVVDINSQIIWQDTIGDDHGPIQQTISITVYNRPDLSITKTGPDEASIGSTVTYTGTLKNNGGSAANTLILVDYLPEGLTFVSSSHNAVYNDIDKTITWSLGTINSGASIDGWVTVKIENTVASNTRLDNSFQVTWKDGDGTDYGPASATHEIIAYTNPILSITKEGPTEAIVGDYVTFTGTVSNIGGSVAYNTTLIDYLPQGMTFVSSSHNAAYNATNRTVTWSLGNINSGVEVPGWITVHIENSVPNASHLVNTFQITWQDNIGTNYGPVTASQELHAYTHPIISINKTGPESGHPGDVLSYTITITNNGGLQARNVILTDVLPGNCTYNSSNPSGQQSNGIVTWNLGSLDANSSRNITVDAIIDPATTDETKSDNIAYVTWQDTQNNTYGPVSKSFITTIYGTPQLRISKTGPATVYSGELCTYNIVISNIGNAEATDIVLTDIFASLMSFVSCSDNGTFTPPGIVTWDIGNIQSDSSKSVTLTLRSDPAIIQNTPLYNSSSAIWQDGSSNNYGPTGNNALTTVYSYPVPLINITGPASGRIGDSLPYTISVTNNSLQTAENVRIYSYLPLGFNFNQADNPGVYANGVITWTLANLPPGSTMNFSFTATPDSTPVGETLVITGAIGWQFPVGTGHGPLYATTNTFINAAPDLPEEQQEQIAQPSSSSSPSVVEQRINIPPKLNIKYLTVQPQQARANQSVIVYANIVNSGDIDSNYKVELKVNGNTEQVKEGTVSGHMAIPLKFEIIREQPGIYNIDINGQSSYFTITGEQSRTDPIKIIFIIVIIAGIACIILTSILLKRRSSTYY